MGISKIIHQTYKHHKLPWIHQYHIKKLKQQNPDYTYCFYDDQQVDQFMQSFLSADDFELFKKIQIGAAKADFFRYAVLYEKGGVYLDVDSLIKSPLNKFVLEQDVAIIAKESHLYYYCQYALFFEPKHIFLAKSIELVLDNLKNNRYPNQVHQMTGPSVFTNAIKLVLEQYPLTPYKELGIDYEGHVKFSFPMSKFFMYGFNKKLHWKKLEKNISVLKEKKDLTTIKLSNL